MKKKIITSIFLCLFFAPFLNGQNYIYVINNTGQSINKLDYWIGSLTESQGTNLIYKSKGSADTGETITIPEKFHKKKRNTVLFKAYLSGGGFVNYSYNISEFEKNVTIKMKNPSAQVPSDNFEKVIGKFKELKIDDDFKKYPTEVAVYAVLGSLYIYDKDEKDILYKISPGELKTLNPKLILPKNVEEVTGIFSSQTSISGSVNLPFVNVSSAFTYGDVSKFHWKVENIGQYAWAPENGIGLAALFNALSPDTKTALINVYSDNPGAKMKFIDELFVIGRIEVETERSTGVETTAELNGSSFVTAKGNYVFNNLLTQSSSIESIVPFTSGYYVTSLLSNLYIKSLIDSRAKLSDQENQRITDEYNYLLSLYPDDLKPTDKVEIMKTAISELNQKFNGKLSFLINKEAKTVINPADLNKSPETNSDKKPENTTEKKPEKK
jgi:hypothetical protein